MNGVAVRPLRQAMDELFDFTSQHCAPHSQLQSLEKLSNQKRAALDTPMRVAFVGRSNAGKSTMLNAFLGEHLAETGNGELTNNVSWIRHGNGKEIRVHLANGGVERHSMEDLRALTTHRSGHSLSEKIQYLEFERPIEMLRKFDLIDTPGLHSFYGTDSRNTQKLLTEEETRPHALVLLFAETLRQDDLVELEKFHQVAGSVMNGLTAIGGLNKVDVYENEKTGALQQGQRVIEQIANKHPQAYRSMFSIIPVVGQSAYGGQLLTQEDLQLLGDLSRTPSDQLQILLQSKKWFCRDLPEYPSLPPAADRERLVSKLDLFGVKRAIEAVLEGVEPDRIAAHLVHVSGVEKLRDLVISHFGNRAYLIKVRAALGALHERGFQLHSLPGDPGRIARDVVNLVQRIELREPRFREFLLLEKHYAGKLELSASEVEDLLLVTGEKGPSCALRLGLESEATVERMVQAATKRLNYWRAVGSDPFGEMERRECAAKLTDSYGHILNRIREAIKHSKAAEELLAYEN